MEKLTINIPSDKIDMVKKVLEALGVTFQKPKSVKSKTRKEKLLKVSVWTDEDLTVFE
jgi:hypothetical protein